jgi:hypothetical protein
MIIGGKRSLTVREVIVRKLAGLESEKRISG